jgi:hypothetical protein
VETVADSSKIPLRPDAFGQKSFLPHRRRAMAGDHHYPHDSDEMTQKT